MTEDTHTITTVLADLLKNITCKPGWRFELYSLGHWHYALRIHVKCLDSRSKVDHTMIITHNFPVPFASYNMESWRRWVFNCCRKVEDHELGEWFLHDGERPFCPAHGPGEDPYMIHEYRDVSVKHTTQSGGLE